MNVLIPWFQINGFDSYPDEPSTFTAFNPDAIDFEGAKYFIANYIGQLTLETGPHVYADYATHLEANPPPVITGVRNISTGAMQRRFYIPEEVFIASDAAATVIKSRLLNASYADLDFQDTIDGVTYICSVLLAGGVIADEAARVTELLRDGTQEEAV